MPWPRYDGPLAMPEVRIKGESGSYPATLKDGILQIDASPMDLANKTITFTGDSILSGTLHSVALRGGKVALDTLSGVSVGDRVEIALHMHDVPIVDPAPSQEEIDAAVESIRKAL